MRCWAYASPALQRGVRTHQRAVAALRTQQRSQTKVGCCSVRSTDRNAASQTSCNKFKILLCCNFPLQCCQCCVLNASEEVNCLQNFFRGCTTHSACSAHRALGRSQRVNICFDKKKIKHLA